MPGSLVLLHLFHVRLRSKHGGIGKSLEYQREHPETMMSMVPLIRIYFDQSNTLCILFCYKWIYCRAVEAETLGALIAEESSKAVYLSCTWIFVFFII